MLQALCLAPGTRFSSVSQRAQTDTTRGSAAAFANLCCSCRNGPLSMIRGGSVYSPSSLHKVAIKQDSLVAFSCRLKLDIFHFQIHAATDVGTDPSKPISALPYRHGIVLLDDRRRIDDSLFRLTRQCRQLIRGADLPQHTAMPTRLHSFVRTMLCIVRSCSPTTSEDTMRARIIAGCI